MAYRISLRRVAAPRFARPLRRDRSLVAVLCRARQKPDNMHTATDPNLLTAFGLGLSVVATGLAIIMVTSSLVSDLKMDLKKAEDRWYGIARETATETANLRGLEAKVAEIKPK